MAVVLTLMGSVLGFVLAIVALVMFQTPVLMALAVWSGTGIVFVVLGLAMALTAPPPQSEPAVQEPA